MIADRALSLVEAVFGSQSAYGGAVIVVGVLFTPSSNTRIFRRH